jgi:uncharacterized membrane protein
MNTFTTDHPLVSQSEDKKPGMFVYLFRVLLIAFIISPFVAILFWLEDSNDIGISTGGYVPFPFWVDFLIAMVVSLFLVFIGAGVFILSTVVFRELRRKS